MIAMPPPQKAANMRSPRIMGGPCSVQVVEAGIGLLPRFFLLGTLPGQAPDADDLGLHRVLDVHRPDHPLLPPRRVVGEEGELAPVVDAEAVRTATRHVVEGDLLGLAGIADVVDEEPGAGVLALVAGQPLGIDVDDVVAHEPRLVHVHARRGDDLGDLVRLPGSETSWIVSPSVPE